VPKCGKLKVKRLIGTGAGLIFKGSGFYITDYATRPYKDKAKAESAPATPAARPKNPRRRPAQRRNGRHPGEG